MVPLSNTCRIAFQGRLLEPVTDRDYQHSVLPTVRLFRLKTKKGTVDRVREDTSVCGRYRRTGFDCVARKNCIPVFLHYIVFSVIASA